MNGTHRVCALTGATGYVGGILWRGLESAGWRVAVLARSGAGVGDVIPWSLDAAGVRDPQSSPRGLENALRARGVSALVHAAWDLRLVRRADLERVNVQGSLRLFDQARAAGVRRIVFISTISAFAGARSDYGQTKLAVEKAAAENEGVILRPGLVYGERAGGMFGALRQRAGSSIVPLIGDGSYPQYLVHENDLSAAVLHALSIVQPPMVPVTVANPYPWTFRELLAEIARSQGKSPHFLRVAWPLIYRGLRFAERLGVEIRFRSDSVLSLVYQNPNPEWNANLLGVEPRPFVGASSPSCSEPRLS
jgi:nucleoside-diphosphate-sugar epimerase